MDLTATMVPQAAEKVTDDPSKLVRRVAYQISPKQILTGVFEFKDLTLGEQAEYEIRRARLAQGVSYDTLSYEARELFSAVAILGIVLEKYPDWYDPSGKSPIIKPDLILELAAAYWEWQQSTFRSRVGEGKGAAVKSAVVVGPVDSEGNRSAGK